MNDFRIISGCITANDAEFCKKQASERLRQIDEARKVITIITNIVRNYTGPKNSALCTKINKNAELLELFPKYPKLLSVNFDSVHSGGKDYSSFTIYCRQNIYLHYQRFYLNDSNYYSFKIDLDHVEKYVNNWLEHLDKDEAEALLLLEESSAGLKNLNEFFTELESLKNKYKSILNVFNIYEFPNKGILPIY